jgi:oligopeptide/dipeptide ABC transporter ATP-binding protein
MYAGKILETATTREIFKTPKHPYTSALMQSVPHLDQKGGRLYSIEGQPPSLLNLPAGCRFASRCPVVKPVCREEEPPEVQVSKGHFVSCWKVK